MTLRIRKRAQEKMETDNVTVSKIKDLEHLILVLVITADAVITKHVHALKFIQLNC